MVEAILQALQAGQQADYCGSERRLHVMHCMMSLLEWETCGDLILTMERENRVSCV